jgi:DNA ligase-1
MITELQMTLGRDWDGRNIAGWQVSEKLDGCRAYWDGAAMWTREGNLICPPAWFVSGLPPCHLDGELWAGRGKFAESVAAVQQGRFTPSIRFMVFDVPEAPGTWAERMTAAPTSLFSGPVPFFTLAGAGGMRQMFAEVKAKGGEGLMLRDPRCQTYEYGRTNKLMKVKHLPPFTGASNLKIAV